jgi:putative DNA primase/helicase
MGTENKGAVVRRYIEQHGLCIVPIEPGRKFPTGDAWNKEGGYFTDGPFAENFFNRNPNHNLGVVLEPSGVCSLDVDDYEYTKLIFDEFGIDLDAIALSYPTIVGNPARWRAMFRVPAGAVLSKKVVQWPHRDFPGTRKKETIVEFRAGLSQDVLPPSWHPTSEKLYEWKTPLGESIPELPLELLNLWENWDVFNKSAGALCPWAPQEAVPAPVKKTSPAPSSARSGPSPIDAFNQAHDVESILESHGYVRKGKRFLCPGSSTGIPGVLVSDGHVYSLHGSDILADGHQHDAFDLFRILEHNGDNTAALKAAAKLLGIERQARPRDPGYCAADDIPPAPSLSESGAVVDVGDESTPAPPQSGEQSFGWTLEKILQRFALVVGSTKVFDLQAQNKPMPKTAFMSYVGKTLGQQWFDDVESRRVIESAQVDVLLQMSAPALEFVQRFVYLYPSQTVWDREMREVVGIKDLKVKLGDDYTRWENHADRPEIRAVDLVFDPTQKIDPSKQINTFNGLPLVPAEPGVNADGSPLRRDLGQVDSGCYAILQMVHFLCNDDIKVIHWLICWLAYPLQNVGAKMASAVLMHSEVQGSGKSLLFDVVMNKIYGEYGRVLGQHQLESQYTDWRSRVLYGVFEEIFSRNEKFNQAGILKQMITGKTQRIEKKFMSGWEEANHMNSAFLSNEVLPFPVEPSDRRMMVIWPQSKLPDRLMADVLNEIDNGGIEAWYRYLLEYPLDGFHGHTEPLMTQAKHDLIYYGLPSWELFYQEWRDGLIDAPFIPCLTEDLYSIFFKWCRRGAEHMMSQTKFSSNLARRVTKKLSRYCEGSKEKQRTFFLPVGCPDGRSEKEWLTGCVAEFRRQAGLEPDLLET